MIIHNREGPVIELFWLVLWLLLGVVLLALSRPWLVAQGYSDIVEVFVGPIVEESMKLAIILLITVYLLHFRNSGVGRGIFMGVLVLVGSGFAIHEALWSYPDVHFLKNLVRPVLHAVFPFIGFQISGFDVENVYRIFVWLAVASILHGVHNYLDLFLNQLILLAFVLAGIVLEELKRNQIL